MAASASLLDRLQAHLTDIESDPSIDIDERLFESCSLTLPLNVSKDASIKIITQLSRILPSLQKDPTQPIHLLILLLDPFTFSDVLSLSTDVDFVAGLDARAPPYNRLMLALFKKATHSSADSATIAARPEVVAALVKLWLCTQDAGIAQEAGSTLLALLKADQAAPPGSGGDPLPVHNQGLMWKRVFGDQDICSLIFSICSLKPIEEPAQPISKGQKTLAQARLLELLPQIGALNWNALAKTHHESIESKYTQGKGEGILYFAAACMVDTKDDVLMHRCLLDFYADLLKTVKQTEQASSSQSSVSLDFLVSNGLHEKALSFYLDPTNPRHDPLDLQFVYAPSAHYLAIYAENYPDHFMASAVRDQTLTRLMESLDLSPSRWAHAESPKHDLHILASLPRAALLPRTNSGSLAWKSSPLSLLPSKSTNPDVLDALATIFHGPQQSEIVTFPLSSSTAAGMDLHSKVEARLARVLYYLYLNHNPRLFEDLVRHADIVALEAQALAAINVIASVIKANWLPLPDTVEENDSSVPTERDLTSWLSDPPIATPPWGALAILSPPSLEHTLPYLLRPPQTFSNIVGGVGDPENPAYKVAMAKFDAIKLLHARAEEEAQKDPGQGFEDIVTTLRKRITTGPWSRQAQVGTGIATMEL